MTDIKLLKEYPQYAPILAYWCYMEWYRERPSIPFDLVLKSFQERSNGEKLPLSWIAVENGIPAGMVSLKEKDLWSRKDLTPWLVSLFVAPEFRNIGISEKLINNVINKTRDIGYKILYLYVWNHLTDIEKYYLRKGWIFEGDAEGNDGKKVKILSHPL